MMKRRTFLPAAAAFGFQIVRPGVLRAQGKQETPNNRIRLAVIGCGGQGGADLGGMAHEDVVALCDVDDRRAADSFGKHPQAKRFRDFRKMFDEMADGIDAVLVATPDHTHFTASMAAMRLGKHVYCEKPLAHSVAELRALRKIAAEKNLVTQVGNQGHSSGSIRGLVEMVRSGAIGNVTEIHCGCDAFKDVYAQQDHAAELTKTEDIPKELDWNLWQGPVAERGYHPRFLPFNWRGHMAYGGGCIGDWICHVVDPSFWALELGMPTAITAEVSTRDTIRKARASPLNSPPQDHVRPSALSGTMASSAFPRRLNSKKKARAAKSSEQVPCSLATRARSCTDPTEPAAGASFPCRRHAM
jgi:predicted dehydrogenase